MDFQLYIEKKKKLYYDILIGEINEAILNFCNQNYCIWFYEFPEYIIYVNRSESFVQKLVTYISEKIKNKSNNKIQLAAKRYELNKIRINILNMITLTIINIFNEKSIEKFSMNQILLNYYCNKFLNPSFFNYEPDEIYQKILELYEESEIFPETKRPLSSSSNAKLLKKIGKDLIQIGENDYLYKAGPIENIKKYLKNYKYSVIVDDYEFLGKMIIISFGLRIFDMSNIQIKEKNDVLLIKYLNLLKYNKKIVPDLSNITFDSIKTDFNLQKRYNLQIWKKKPWNFVKWI